MGDVAALLDTKVLRATPAFYRTNLALFCAGFSTFALMYCLQPLMPLFAREFHISAADSSLSISVTTGSLAVSMLFAGGLSEAWGRKPMMVASLFSSAVLTVASAFTTNWAGFLIFRALEGLAFSGLPSVAMAYLSEEMDTSAVGLAMGLYIGGTAIGGMSGRLIVGVLTDAVSWRFAIAAIGVLGLLSAAIFWRSLPPSSNFAPHPLVVSKLVRLMAEHMRDSGLRWLYIEGFLLMGTFVTLYNYIGFRLVEPPYGLTQSQIGLIFTVYLVGAFSSAWVGNLAGRLGRRKVLWITISLMLAGLAGTLVAPLPLIIVSIACFTFGFFGSHSIVSSWVGLRARHSKAQASSLYLFFYYLGSSIVGSAGGLFWHYSHWLGVASFTGVLLMIAVLISIRLASTS
ncbi:MAG TPA: MFS transporter [Bryobacteraceae bacterium]|jgi:YNFM family putative membrane transporter|nr:MFS transporter [Bryobacteraceae bacterium]